MKKIVLFLFLCVVAVALAMAADGTPKASVLPASALFDDLDTEADVVYLVANSSVIFGPDPHGRSEEVTFIGPVTVPKWPMKGYGRRLLPDGRQQIDIELTQSELTGESYMLGGPIVLGEHPDLRSLGTITERPKPKVAPASTTGATTDSTGTADGSAGGSLGDTSGGAGQGDEDAAPADFVVQRKVLMTTAKGILYNETAVPVRGRIDSIPPVKFEGTAMGVNVFRGMELPVALLDKDGNVNGWFYSKAHMAYATKPAAIERSFLKGKVQLRSGDQTESVEISGPVEIHHLKTPGGTTEMEVMILALRGRSDLLGGDIMLAETFSDRDRFSRGQLAWSGDNADSNFELFVDVYTPSGKLTTREPLPVSGKLVDVKASGKLDKGKLSLPMLSGKGHFATSNARALFNEAEKAVVDVVKLEFDLAERM